MLKRLCYLLVFAVGTALATWSGCHLVVPENAARRWLLQRLFQRWAERRAPPKPAPAPFPRPWLRDEHAPRRDDPGLRRDAPGQTPDPPPYLPTV